MFFYEDSMLHLLRQEPQTLDCSVWGEDMDQLLASNRTVKVSDPKRARRSLDLGRILRFRGDGASRLIWCQKIGGRPRPRHLRDGKTYGRHRTGTECGRFISLQNTSLAQLGAVCAIE